MTSLRDLLHRCRVWFTCYVPQFVKSLRKGKSLSAAHRDARVIYNAFRERVEQWDL